MQGRALEELPYLGRLAVAVAELASGARFFVALGNDRGAVADLQVAILGLECLGLVADLVGERVALQAGNLIESLAHFAQANLDLLAFCHGLLILHIDGELAG